MLELIHLPIKLRRRAVGLLLLLFVLIGPQSHTAEILNAEFKACFKEFCIHAKSEKAYESHLDSTVVFLKTTIHYYTTDKRTRIRSTQNAELTWKPSLSLLTISESSQKGGHPSHQFLTIAQK